MTRPPLLLVRHGETEWNVAGRRQGRGDSRLTPRGLAQAHGVAERARAFGLVRVFASPLGRARATAALIGGASGAPVDLVPELAELDFGACAGLTEAEIGERWPSLAAERAAEPWTCRWPGGESYADAAGRLERWRAREPFAAFAGPAAIVSHRALLRALLVTLGGWPRARALETTIPSAQAWWLHPGGELVAADAAPR